MRIKAIETYPVRIPLKPAYRMISALGRHEVSEFLLVRVLTDDGREGAGEATVTPRWSGETVWGAKALIDRLFGPATIGQDPADVSGLLARWDALANHNWFAKAALEMACWDLQGQAAERPVYELLGGAVRPRQVRSRFSIGAYPPERAAARACELVQAGFTTLKVKVGGIVSEDLARVRAVRDAVGLAPDLVIDANGGWTAETAIECLRDLADCRVGWMEQPTPEGDYAGLARVRRESGVPLLADEACFNLIHAQELLRQGCCDGISVYPGKNGGLLKTRQIVELAEEHRVGCTIGSNLEWDVATAAMAHGVVSCRNLQVEAMPGDMLGPDYHEFSIVKEPLVIVGPLTTIPDKPGLGVEVDWDRARREKCPE